MTPLLVAVLLGVLPAQAPVVTCADPGIRLDGRITVGAQGRPMPYDIVYDGVPGCDRADDPLTAEITWGDGSSSSLTVTPTAPSLTATVGSWKFAGQHTYARPGTYPIVINVRNGRTGVVRAWPRSAADIGPTGERRFTPALRWRAGHRFNGEIATVRVPEDMTQYNTYRVRIAWGDGRTSSGTLRRLDRTTLSVRGRHTWREPLRRAAVKATLTDTRTGGVLVLRRTLQVRS